MDDRSGHIAPPPGPLDGMRVVVLAAEGLEDLEYWVTVMRLREAGAVVTSAATSADRLRGKNGLEVKPDRVVSEVDPRRSMAW